ncbi:MAG TPA: ADP-glyceromanno-heptose 6-epimerase [Chitinophagaceae bacterium]
MDRNAVIIVTGAAGFIGSCLVGYLNRKGYNNIIIVDDFTKEEKKLNYIDKKIVARVERDELFNWLEHVDVKIDFVFHIGARTDTTEFDYSIHQRLNVEYSQRVWNLCIQKNVPLVYASSAATYGDGVFGYSDDHDLIEKLRPLNPYGVSKNEFDKWVLKQHTRPPFWAGLKFFNVYGPNEYHKGRMASVIFHSFNQIKKTGKVKLFRSHNPRYKDGEQLRDFIYADDVVKIMYWIMNKRSSDVGRQTSEDYLLNSGIYNVGTGKARSFNDLAQAIFASMELEPRIEYIDTPADIRDKYQYFTQAEMNKLHESGYSDAFFSLEDGIKTYVLNFLLSHRYY